MSDNRPKRDHDIAHNAEDDGPNGRVKLRNADTTCTWYTENLERLKKGSLEVVEAALSMLCRGPWRRMRAMHLIQGIKVVADLMRTVVVHG